MVTLSGYADSANVAIAAAKASASVRGFSRATMPAPALDRWPVLPRRPERSERPAPPPRLELAPSESPAPIEPPAVVNEARDRDGERLCRAASYEREEEEWGVS